MSCESIIQKLKICQYDINAQDCVILFVEGQIKISFFSQGGGLRRTLGRGKGNSL